MGKSRIWWLTVLACVGPMLLVIGNEIISTRYGIGNKCMSWPSSETDSTSQGGYLLSCADGGVESRPRLMPQ